MQGEPRLLHHERRVWVEQWHPHQPRSIAGDLFDQLQRCSDGRLVAVNACLVTLIAHVERLRHSVPFGVRDACAGPQLRVRVHQVAAEVSTCFGDAWGEHVATVAEHADAVPSIAHQPKQVRFVGAQQVLQRAVTGDVWVPPGHQRDAAWTADRVLRPCLGEAGSATGECIDVRCVHHWIAEAPHDVGALLIRHEQEDVRAGHRCER